MKSRFFLLSILIVVVFAGCAGNKIKKEEAKQIRKLGEAYMAEDKYLRAYREFAKARDLNPKDPHIHYDLGFFFFKKKKYQRAIEQYQKALDLKPSFATARNNMGIVYMEQEKWDKAIETLEPITEDYIYATPHYPHFLIGQAFFHKKEYKKALTHFKEALELKSDYFFARHWLGKTHLAAGNPEKAVAALEKAVEELPQAAIFHYDLGRAYQTTKQYKKAKKSFSQACSLAKDEDLKKKAAQRKQMLEQRN